MSFIKLLGKGLERDSFVNVNHIVAVLAVANHKNESWTRVFTTALEEGSENYGSVALTFDTDETPNQVMEKILETKLNPVFTLNQQLKGEK